MSRVCKPVRMTAVLSKQGGTSCPYPAMPLESCQSWLSVGATIGGTAVLEVSDALTWQAHVLSTNCSGVTGVLMIVTIRELCLPAGLQQGTEDTGHVVNLSRSNHGQSGSNLDCTIITLPARGPRIVLSPWHRRVRRDGQWSLAERKRDCDVSSATHPASSAPAAVTDLMFLQVPAYPEVFRDGLHTFKLNEQDTDVRAALPAPSDTMCSSCCPPHPRSPLWGFSFIPLPLLVAFHPFDSPSLIRTTTVFHLLPPPPSAFPFGLGPTAPSSLTLLHASIPKLWVSIYSSGIGLGQRLRLC